MPDPIFSVQASLTVGILAAIIAILGFIIPRIADHSVNQNLRILQELMVIRKDMDRLNPDAIKMDEIIVYRRKRYLKRQIESYERVKKDDLREEAKNKYPRNLIQRIYFNISNNLLTLGAVFFISAFAACLYFSVWFAGILAHVIVK